MRSIESFYHYKLAADYNSNNDSNDDDSDNNGIKQKTSLTGK